MSDSNSNPESAGDEVMKAIGELGASTAQLKSAESSDSDVDPAEVGNWITTLGKAILSIFE